MKRPMVLFMSFILIIFWSSCGDSYMNRIVTGESHAKQEINEAIHDTTYKPLYDTLIKTKETAIGVAEPILFDIYTKDQIVAERPYESYLINGYWYISGTLKKNYLEGVFEIILNSKDGKVIKIMHGK